MSHLPRRVSSISDAGQLLQAPPPSRGQIVTFNYAYLQSSKSINQQVLSELIVAFAELGKIATELEKISSDSTELYELHHSHQSYARTILTLIGEVSTMLDEMRDNIKNELEYLYAEVDIPVHVVKEDTTDIM